MTLLRTALLAVFLAVAAPARAQQDPAPAPAATESDPKAWKEFVSPEGRFSMLFPGTPVKESHKVETPEGLLDTHMLYLKSASSSYAAYYTDYPQPVEAPARVKQALDTARDGAVKQAGGRILEEKEFTLDGVRGRYLVVLAGSGTTIRSKILMVKRRFYTLAVFTDERNAPPAKLRLHEAAAAKFLDSFKLLPAGAGGARP